MSKPPMTLDKDSTTYAALSELAYRRDPETVITHIDNVKGVQAYNPLESESLQSAAGEQSLTDYVSEQYGLTIDIEERRDGLIHFHTDNGLSAFISIKENDPDNTADDQIIVTFRGTDVADDGQNGMIGGLTPILKQLGGSAARDLVSDNWARNNHPSKEEFMQAIAEATDARNLEGNIDINEYTVTRNEEGGITNRLVDPGDWYTNILLGQGTYQETQYDDARALVQFIKDHVATDGQEIISNGQSLGGGLAALVGIENDLETHTFGMAPFQNQLEIIAERSAVRDMILDENNETGLSELREDYLNSTLPERSRMERDIANAITDLRTGTSGHDGRNATNRINDFNRTFKTDIDRADIHEFREASREYQIQYEGNKDNITAVTVRNEFTTNAGDGSWLGWAVSAGSEQIIPTENLYMIDIGADQTRHHIKELADEANYGNWINNPLNAIQPNVRGMGEGLVTHSPALNGLLVATEKTDREFSEIFRDNEQFRYSIFHRPGLAGGVTGGKVGPDNDPSATQSDMPSSETIYRALANSVSGDGELYSYTYDLFTGINDSGRAAEGAGAGSPADSNLSSGINQIALQKLRIDTRDLAPGQTLSGESAQFASNFQETGLLEFNLSEMVPVEPTNADNDLAGKQGIHGYREIQEAIYENVRENLIRPSDTGMFEREINKIAGISDEITGANLEFLKFGFQEGRLQIPDDALNVGMLYVQTGEKTGQDVDLNNSETRELANRGEGVAVFMGDGNNSVSSGNAKDFAMLGDGDDTFIATLKGGDIVVGDGGYDTYAVAQGVGPVIATIGENVTRISTRSDHLSLPESRRAESQDQLIGVEEIQGTQSTDIYNIEAISGTKVIDGIDGGDYVNYAKLGGDFELFTDDIMVDGTTYSARLTDGENTFYFLNIPDENISNIRTVTPEELRRNFSDVEAQNRKEIELSQAVEILAKDQAALNQRFDDTGTTTAVRDAINHPDALQMFKNLFQHGVRVLKTEVTKEMDPEERAANLLVAGEEATRAAQLPLPEEDKAIELEASKNPMAETHTASQINEEEYSHSL